MFSGFRTFVMRGNVIDLAVGVVIGAAFGKVIDAFVGAFVDPLVKLATGGREVSAQTKLTDQLALDWGMFINALITFVLTAAVVYFVFVVPMNKLNERRPAQKEQAELSDEAKLLTEIRDELRADSRVTPRQVRQGGAAASAEQQRGQ